jgi:hypothetical protein
MRRVLLYRPLPHLLYSTQDNYSTALSPCHIDITAIHVTQ